MQHFFAHVVNPLVSKFFEFIDTPVSMTLGDLFLVIATVLLLVAMTCGGDFIFGDEDEVIVSDHKWIRRIQFKQYIHAHASDFANELELDYQKSLRKERWKVRTHKKPEGKKGTAN